MYMRDNKREMVDDEGMKAGWAEGESKEHRDEEARCKELRLEDKEGRMPKWGMM